MSKARRLGIDRDAEAAKASAWQRKGSEESQLDHVADLATPTPERNEATCKAKYETRIAAIETVLRAASNAHLIDQTGLDLSLFYTAIEAAPCGVVVADARRDDMPVVYCNVAFTQLTGYAEHEIIGRNCRILSAPETDSASRARIRAALKKGEAITVDLINRRKSGEAFPNRLALTPIRDRTGEVVNYLGFQTDLSHRREALELAAANELRDTLIDAIESIPDSFGLFDAADQLVLCNRLYAQTFTLHDSFDAIKGMKFGDLVRSSVIDKGEIIEPDFGGDLEAWVAERVRRHRQPGGSLRQIRFSNGKWLQVSERPTKRGGIVGVRTDITELKNAQEKAERLAGYDPLTKLANRRMVMERLGEACGTDLECTGFGAIMLIDVDHFKTINDTQGHDFGDEILIEFAERLRETIGGDATIARLGGDEFIAMLPDLGTVTAPALERAGRIAQRVHDSLRRPFHVMKGMYDLTASIGISLYSRSTKSVNELLKEADLALYAAKTSGRNSVRFFDEEVRDQFAARVETELCLRKALANGEFVLHFQPQVTSGGQIVGAEALLRWIDPDRPHQACLPKTFISTAERSGLINPIGAWVLDAACRQLAAWQTHETTRDLTVSVNVSAVQFRHPDFVDQLTAIVARTGAPSNRLKLELTESLLLGDLETIIDRMHRLRRLGFKISIDDFGTGYSSLNYVRRLPLDEIKIDRSFVADITDSGADGTVIKFIMFLARSLHLRVIAEGVETPCQRDFLAVEGCEYFQGYLYGKPVGPGDLFAPGLV